MSINLLPWRQQKRKQKYKKLLYRMAIYTVFLIFFSLVIKLFFYFALQKTHSKIALLNHQIRAIHLQDPQHNNELLLKKLLYFDAQKKPVRQQNNAIENVLFHTANVIPNSIILDQLSIETKKISLTGKSDQLPDIHHYVDALQAEKIGNSTQLVDIQTDEKNHSSMRFTIEIPREAQQHEK